MPDDDTIVITWNLPNMSDTPNVDGNAPSGNGESAHYDS